MNARTMIYVLAICLCLGILGASADVPHYINFQGSLTDTSGNPITGTQSIQFFIYADSISIVALWTESQPSVNITDGLFKVSLGSVTPLPPSLFNSNTRWLGIRVSPDATELFPRQPIRSVPYSLRAIYSDTAQYANSAAPDNDWTISGSNIYRTTGYVGIGTASPGYNLHVEGQAISGINNLATGSFSTVNGGKNNIARGWYSVVAGGGGATSADSNSASGNYSAIGGGSRNTARGLLSTIGGGYGNSATEHRTTVGGGLSNTASDVEATVGGGSYNSATNTWATVSGGFANTANGSSATVGGGRNNGAGYCAVIAGGCGSLADGENSAIGGGSNNIARGVASTIPGGMDNIAEGDYSVAMGRQAKAVNDGSFVWADGSGQDFSTTDKNQFLIRAQGGVGIGTANPQSPLDVAGNIRATGNMECVALNQVSDLRLKTDIQPICDALSKIELLQGVSFRWNQNAKSVGATPGDQQIGVIAQDIEKVFPELVTTPDNGYKSVDYTKLTAVLIEAVKELKAQNEKLQAEIDNLKTERK